MNIKNQIRSNILANIRKSIGHANPEILTKRLATHPVHEQPVLEKNLIARFTKQVEKVTGTLKSIHNSKEIPSAILEFLLKHDLPQKLVMDSRLSTLTWPNELQLAYRAANNEDVVSISYAFAGVAETGSLVLLSSSESPTTLNFLPANHIIILTKDNLVAYIEDVWPRLRSCSMPRTVNFITGPSRTADIEQTIQLGAHGPKRLHVVLVNDLFDSQNE